MTKKESKEKRIEDIIYAAVDEFVEKGFSKTSVDSIAARAGVSKGGVYYHFASKDEILLAVHQKLSEPVYTMMETAKNSNSIKAGLSRYIEDYLTYWHSRPRELVFFFLSMAKALPDSALWPLYGEYTEYLLDFFTNLYEQGINSGELKPQTARVSALALVSALDGVLAYLIMDDKLSLKEVTEMFKSHFIKY